ncbi:MAG: ATP-binding protein [Firmicutes bacterium]|nr:ATP-binding protein [Bacillota bacterium]
MEIYTLTGSSGTGKSYRAMDICKEHNIDAVIDDGLFIYKGTIIAGESAKKSGTKIGAIKEAIFNDEQKAKKVARAIRHKNPRSILILGTSDAMADLIIERLELNMSKRGHRKVSKPVKRIYIEDITTEAERTEARKQRKNMGKHVIPAPAMQLKRSFAGYFLDTLGLFKGRAQATNERTVVRPSYSYIGDYVLSDKVINDICEITARKKKIISDVIMVTQEPSPENYVINIAVKIRPNCSLWDDVLDYQKAVNDMVEEMTAFNVSEVNVEVRGIDYGRNSYI